jgi:hypothetical protein
MQQACAVSCVLLCRLLLLSAGASNGVWPFGTAEQQDMLRHFARQCAASVNGYCCSCLGLGGCMRLCMWFAICWEWNS